LVSDLTLKKTGSVFRTGVQYLFWTGYVLPDNYIEPFHDHKDYIVTFDCIDGLGRLQDTKFLKDDGSYYSGKLTVLDWLREIMFKTGLSLPFEISLSFDELYTPTSAWNCILNRLYLDADTFYVKETPTCDYVLRQILQSFGARIVQSKGSWSIKEVTKYAGSHLVYKSDLTTFTHNPVRDYSRVRSFDRLLFSNKEGDLQISPAFKQFTIKHDFLKRKSILLNSDFTNARYSEYRSHTFSDGSFNYYKLPTYWYRSNSEMEPILNIGNVP